MLIPALIYKTHHDSDISKINRSLPQNYALVEIAFLGWKFSTLPTTTLYMQFSCFLLVFQSFCDTYCVHVYLIYEDKSNTNLWFIQAFLKLEQAFNSNYWGNLYNDTLTFFSILQFFPHMIKCV